MLTRYFYKRICNVCRESTFKRQTDIVGFLEVKNSGMSVESEVVLGGCETNMTVLDVRGLCDNCKMNRT